MKKSLLIILFLLFSGNSFSQDFKIPELVWQGNDKTENSFIELLKLKDKNSLIVKIGYSSYWSKGQNSEFIVYQNNGKVKRFVVYQPSSTEKKTKIRRKRIKKKEYQYYWKYLNDCVSENKLKIDKSKLNITQKKGEKEGTMISMNVSDGANYSFWICQGKNYLAYGSYAPIPFIEGKFPGYKERKKLVDLMNGFEKLTKKY